ncbi:hypothetical protein [Colwellia sp. RSH04]|uniref:hypothetical protein n=1 Tax=Colwellia sp. RSH04 TaxID=2305464 RepID=UPI000E57FACA|nr:hypothetical protein [Colwellia sp. RSH04]RHW76109.1 hypothetical protein D1094_10635 [Colwellia sp. RSH04]
MINRPAQDIQVYRTHINSPIDRKLFLGLQEADAYNLGNEERVKDEVDFLYVLKERRTMIYTYLALSRKGQGPKDEDRQLILQTLFRPSTTDMLKNDQGPTQLVDMINRFSPKS